MKNCIKCNSQIADDAKKCPYCETIQPSESVYNNSSNISGCPRCGSHNIKVVSETNGKSQGFDLGKGCLGYLCLGPWGWLCGLCGMGKGYTSTTTYRMCVDCGARFR